MAEDRQLHVAPMAAVTDRHFRMLVRCISPLPVVWTEMIWDRAVVDAAEKGRLEAVLGFSAAEHPVVLQLGGGDPALLARAAALGGARGYDAVNLNCGCPAGGERSGGSARAHYGARLMLDPARVAACCAAMRAAAGEGARVSVKCRLGVDGRGSYDELASFVRTVASDGGVRDFYVHARHAMLDLDASDNLSATEVS